MDLLYHDVHDDLYIGLEKTAKKDPLIYCRSAYQYSTLHVLDSILEFGKLHATSVEFLNDTGEYHFVADQLPDGDDGKDYKFFSISFTTKKDDVPQYMIYAGEIGIGIEYDFSEQIIPFDSENGKHPFYDCCLTYEIINRKQVTRIADGLKKCKRPVTICYYKEKSVMKLVKSFFNNINTALKDRERNKLEKWQEAQLQRYYACFFKNSAFHSEEEVRIAFGVAGSGKVEDTMPEIMPRIQFLKHPNKLLRPYMQIFYCIFDKANNKKQVGWPIKSIWIGPGRDQLRAFTSVKMRLEAGKVIIFPLPLHIFMERLVNFIAEALDFFNELAKKEGLTKTNLFDNKLGTLTNIFYFNSDKFPLKEIKPHRKTESVWMWEQRPECFEYKDKEGNTVVIPFTEDGKWRCLGLNNDDVRKEAEHIIVFIKNVLYKALESKIDELLNGIVVKEKKSSFIDNIFMRWRKEFESSYYFSSWGISVYKSRKKLSLN